MSVIIHPFNGVQTFAAAAADVPQNKNCIPRPPRTNEWSTMFANVASIPSMGSTSPIVWQTTPAEEVIIEKLQGKEPGGQLVDLAITNTLQVDAFLYIVANDALWSIPADKTLFSTNYASFLGKLENINKNFNVEMASVGADIFISNGSSSWVFSNTTYTPSLNVPILEIFQDPQPQPVINVQLKNQEVRVVVSTTAPHHLVSGQIIRFSKCDGFTENDGYKIIATDLPVTVEDDKTFSVRAAKTNTGEIIIGASATYTVDVDNPLPLKIASLAKSERVISIVTEGPSGLRNGELVNLLNFAPKTIDGQYPIFLSSSQTGTLLLPEALRDTRIETMGTVGKVVGSSGWMSVAMPHGLSSGMGVAISGALPGEISPNQVVFVSDGTTLRIAATGNFSPVKNNSYSVTHPIAPVENPSFPGAIGCASMLGFVFAPALLSTIPGAFVWSKPYAPAIWPAQNFATCETITDRLVAIREVDGVLIMLGSTSLEIWAPTSSGANPIAYVAGSSTRIGCCSAKTAVSIGSKLLFMGAAPGDTIGTYFWTGENFTRVSTREVEIFWKNAEASQLRASGWVQDGDIVYAVQIADEAEAWIWHHSTGTWVRGPCAGYRFGVEETSFAINASTSKIVQFLTTDAVSSSAQTMSIVSENIAAPGGITIKSVLANLTFLSSRPDISGEIWLEFSNDNGATWTEAPERHAIRQTGPGIPAPYVWRQLSTGANFILRLTLSSMFPVEITDVAVNVLLLENRAFS